MILVGLGRPGRVVLSAPGGYEDLVEAAWPSVVKRVPPDYEPPDERREFD